MSAISIAIVDDHPLMAEGIASVLQRRAGFAVAATGSNAGDILSIAANHQVDAIIVDLNMPGDVFQAIADTCRDMPGTKIVVFTASTSTEHAMRALDAGAGGYVLKGSPANELFEAIEAARRGEIYITPSFATKVIGALQSKALEKQAVDTAKLSVREEQIVRLLLCGKRNSEIARTLVLSEKTVKGYMTNLMNKLRARNRLEVVIAAQRLNPASFVGLGSPTRQPVDQI
ncbi:DNA-binding response regulator [Bosea caraganae]|uniref:DNA-binding response regulator n=1 Tax=Bosea caraganae TaxID=2763117 RepID=A0A370LBQ3_9HYPH|nr:response regulator transcription factor [Bosea caraganae]RDJ27263.1 DNA-binding response regulator [Bosea caraganae]RDJ29279.1 DNA-binding response regulator [Bosea caraganae]